MSAREQILARLRAAPAGAATPVPDVAAWYRQHTRREDRVQRVERLRSALQAAHAEVHDVTDDSWVGVLLQLARARGWRRLLLGTGVAHAEALAPAATEASLHVVRYGQAVEAWKDALFDDIDVALTGARSAIAETGSLILWPDASEPRLMSLVPPVHLVLVDVDRIHADLHAALTAEAWAEGLPTNALLVSGPSKTADIQQTLAYGAHGPRELIVLLRWPQGEGA